VSEYVLEMTCCMGDYVCWICCILWVSVYGPMCVGYDALYGLV